MGAKGLKSEGVIVGEPAKMTKRMTIIFIKVTMVLNLALSLVPQHRMDVISRTSRSPGKSKLKIPADILQLSGSIPNKVLAYEVKPLPTAELESVYSKTKFQPAIQPKSSP